MRFGNLSKFLAIGAMLLPMTGLLSLSGCFVSSKERVVEKDDHPRVVEHDKTVIDHR